MKSEFTDLENKRIDNQIKHLEVMREILDSGITYTSEISPIQSQ